MAQICEVMMEARFRLARSRHGSKEGKFAGRVLPNFADASEEVAGGAVADLYAVDRLVAKEVDMAHRAVDRMGIKEYACYTISRGGRSFVQGMGWCGRSFGHAGGSIAGNGLPVKRQ